MNYDKILTQLGEYGPWQVGISLMLWLPALIDGIMTMTNSYSALIPETFRCNIPACDGPLFAVDDFPENEIFPSFDNLSSKYNPDNPDFCTYYKPRVFGNGSCGFSSTQIAQCDSSSIFTYDQDTYVMKSTLVTEYSMFCDEEKKIWITLFNSLFMIGLGIGSLIFGILSDYIGRRHSLGIAIVTCSGACAAGSFMPTYWSYGICRMIVGIGAEGCFVVAFTISLEIVGVRESVPGLPWVSFATLQGTMMTVPFALGLVMVSLAVLVALNEWRDLELALAIFSFACGAIWFFIPESPRWLIAKGKDDEAFQVIRVAAKRNGVKLTGEIFTDDDHLDISKEIPEYKISDIFNPSVVKISLALFVFWSVSALLYFGLTFSADNIHLTENTILSFILIALMEIPSAPVLLLLMDVWGRKPLLVVSLLIPGVCCLGAAMLEEGIFFAILVLIGKFCSSGAHTVAYISTAELYPTSIRTTMLGTCSAIARVGGVSSTWVATYLPKNGVLSKNIPLYIFGASSLLGGLMALLIPETLGSSLPNTFQDVETIKMKGKSIWSCIDPRKSKESGDHLDNNRSLCTIAL